MNGGFDLSLRFWQRRRLPILLQTEVSDCGLACVAMIASFWGHETDISTLRHRHATSLRGVTLRGLISLCESLGLQCRALRLDLDNLQELRLPCVLHWGMSHFVVLKKVGRTSVTIHDPAAGERQVPFAQFSERFTGVGLELTPGGNFVRSRSVHHFRLRDLMGRVVGLRRGVAQMMALGIVLQGCALAAPFYLQWVVDEALVNGDKNLLAPLGMGFLCLVAIQAAVAAVRAWIAATLSTDLAFQWLGNSFAHLMRLPLPFFEKRHLGDIVSRFGSIQTIQRSITGQFVEAWIDGLLALTTLGVMFVYSPQLAAMVVSSTLVYALLRRAMYPSVRAAASEQVVLAARQQSHFIESARGVPSIRLFDRSEERRAGWMNLLARQFNGELKTARLSIAFQTSNVALFGIERVAVVWLGALAVLDARFSAGMLFAFIAYRDQFVLRASSLLDKASEFGLLRLHGERVADILLTPAAEASRPSTFAKQASQPVDIEFTGVSFRYSNDEPFILKNLSLVIPHGQSIAITGASGCGKTTLIKLLLGMLEPSEGDVLVGGSPIRRFGLKEYRAQIGAVMQDDLLFAGSVAENISFFDPSPDPAAIQGAATIAAIHDEIQAWPMGYLTTIGESGAGLSGGQRQRILLARALYKQPSILVLDEATSHLDVWNEHEVNRSIRQLNLTRIIVAHRPETIASAERVVVLEKGTIARDFLAQQGTQAHR